VRSQSDTFFRELLSAAGPSGDEREAARVWRAYTTAFADVRGDALGSSYATVNPAGERSVVVMGHIDEIGLAITHIDDEGYLWFSGVGGWTPAVLVAQRIRILAKDGPIVGVVGQKAPHLAEPEDKEKPLRLDHLWIDIGAADGDEARTLKRSDRCARSARGCQDSRPHPHGGIDRTGAILIGHVGRVDGLTRGVAATRLQSVGFTPDTETRTRTSPGPGSGTGRSTRRSTSGSPVCE
jgi:hypothetical protein